ncbi:MAG: MiaB/RimO family radical SAM methylthiotransferase [Patescibacteria group bacterium]|jgi:threonylcarbamoyladenosine tRNA methylthiotransferase MtaB|nr:MiaB/RimO family radical SAM methylthiotransferase [Patescibacteria group bacterium]
MKKVKFKIYTTGCKVNQYDSAFLARLLKEEGLIEAESDLDLIIINSCSVTQKAILKNQRLIRTLRRDHPKVKIVLIGCWPKVYSVQDSNVDLVLSSKEVSDIVLDIKKAWPEIFLGLRKAIVDPLNLIEDRSRYFIKIQDGCQQFCSYCIIPLARGPLSSRSLNEITCEIRAALDYGFSEIVLSGIHLGLYRDREGNDLYQALKTILNLKSLGRLRLSSIEATEISSDIIKLFDNDKFCRHLHIPLQSGSDKILSLMNRPYQKEYFLNKVQELRQKSPDIAISTDLIVGFPGESEDDFLETVDFCRQINFSKIHVFSFSDHEKAAAFNFPDKVEPQEIKRRSEIVRALSKDLERNYRDQILKKSKTLNLLVENINDKIVKLKTEFYFDLYLDFSKLKPYGDLKPGQIIKYKL